MISPGFDVEFVAVDWGGRAGNSYYDDLQMGMSVFEIEALKQKKKAMQQSVLIRLGSAISGRKKYP